MPKYDDETHKALADTEIKDISKATIDAIECLIDNAYIDFMMQTQRIGYSLNAAWGHCKFIRNLQEKMNCRDKAGRAYDESMDTLKYALKKKCD